MVGQREAKKTLAVGVYQHYRRLANNLERKLQQQQLQQGVQQVQQVGGVHPSNQYHQYGTFSTGLMPPNLGNVGQQHFADQFTVSESHPAPNVTQLTYHPTRGTPITAAHPNAEPPSNVPDHQGAFRRMQEDEDMIRLEKSNIMLLGPSGVGKTFVTQVGQVPPSSPPLRCWRASWTCPSRSATAPP